MSPFLSSAEIQSKIEECRSQQLRAVAVLPVGCTEQHGPFLPVQTDTLIAEHLAVSLCEILGSRFWGYVFPAVAYTPTKSNEDYAGTVSVDEDSFRQYVRQICGNILMGPFDALVILSGHGPADPSLREIAFNLVHTQYTQAKHLEKPVIMASLFDCRQVLERTFGHATGQHADWRELLYLIHILPKDYFDSNKTNALLVFQRKNEFKVKERPVLGMPVSLRSTKGVMGDPTPPIKGDWRHLAEMAWEATVTHLAGWISRGLDDCWKQDSLC